MSAIYTPHRYSSLSWNPLDVTIDLPGYPSMNEPMDAEHLRRIQSLPAGISIPDETGPFHLTVRKNAAHVAFQFANGLREIMQIHVPISRVRQTIQTVDDATLAAKGIAAAHKPPATLRRRSELLKNMDTIATAQRAFHSCFKPIQLSEQLSDHLYELLANRFGKANRPQADFV